MMDNIIQETIQYTRQRKIFKMPVLYHQSVHFRLAELETEIELLRSLLHRSTGGSAQDKIMTASQMALHSLCSGLLLTRA